MLKRRAPLADFTFEEVEIELCSRLFPIILDRGNTIELGLNRSATQISSLKREKTRKLFKVIKINDTAIFNIKKDEQRTNEVE